VRRHVIANPAGPAAPFQRDLEQLLSRHRYDVILATADLTLARLASVDVPVVTSPSLGRGWDALNDKLALADVAARSGVEYPATASAETDAGIDGAAAAFGLPVVVKAMRSAEADAEGVRLARGATPARDVVQAIAAARRLRSTGVRPIIQAAVSAAEKVNAVVIRSGGRSELRYAHRVNREVPITGGIGVSLETIPAESGDGREAVDALERLCDTVGYEGLAQAEFYRGADDGRLYVLDVNPRLWGSTWFAERLGLRVTERSIRVALGLPSLPPVRYEVGRRFHAPFGELRWVRDQHRRLGALAALARASRPGDVVDYWDPGDLRPVAVLAALVVGGYRPE
jgi:phosphoribosylaminoimidazole carboxylase (NCAIR synthetase)